MQHVLLAISNAVFPSTLAAFYSGGGVEEGVDRAADVSGSGDLRSVVEAALQHGLTIMGAIAVLAIVISGVIILVQGGDESARQRGIRGVLYAVVGLILILLASAIVTYVSDKF